MENILDLKITTARIDRNLLMNCFGPNMILPEMCQTFVMIDFFDHLTQSSDLEESYEPVFNTQFVFKNAVNDFYITMLKNDAITVEMFMAKG